MAKRETDDSLESIAIIGMAGRFPGAKSIEQFWQNLCDGKESISFFTDEELVAAGVDPALLSDPNYVKASPVLEDIEMFDALFFGFTPREAEVMDPQHRLFLECAWEALENAGYNSETYEGLIGVYAGAALNTYLLRNLNSHPDIFNLASASQILIGNNRDFLPTRVSYKLNLKGPSVNIGTACSTSLVAVQMGCQSLLNYQCDMVLAGGVTIASRKEGYLYQEGGIASPDGHCRAFDAKAQGTIGGNGVGIVVLKRLEDALADGDSIYAVIKGSEINNDGSLKAGYTAPSTEGQAKVIAEAMAIASVAPETITYIETHGTGTALGDPIEIAALTKVFRAGTNKRGFCAIGSLKTNIGHLGTTAGVAGLIKTVLALKHKMIPPSLHFEQPNPKIDFANSPFYVNKSLREWQTDGILRRAGVSSFGIGGTNAHIILEEAPNLEVSGDSRPWHLLLLSAKTNSALETATTNLAEYLEQHPEVNLADVAYTLQVGRWAFSYRRMLVVRCFDVEGLDEKPQRRKEREGRGKEDEDEHCFTDGNLCGGSLGQNFSDGIMALKSLDGQGVFTHFSEFKQRSIVFMFPGQGAQYVNMGRELYQTEPIFRDIVERCCQLLKLHQGIDLRHVLYSSEEQGEQVAEQLKQTFVSQLALFVIEYALAKLWMAWGVCPQATIGHSIGEYVAATLAGVFSLEDALALVATRGRLMQQVCVGTMLSVPLPETEVIPLLDEKLSLAANNAPSLCVVSGTTDAINDLQNRLLEQGVECRRLHTSHAFHSQMMEPIVERFTESLRKVNLNPPKIPFVSNVSGTWITAAEATDPSYWAKHLRQTVRFSEGMTELLKDTELILLEVGPGRTLTTFAKQHQVNELVALTSLRHPQEQLSDVAFLLNTLGRLWLLGVKVDWSGFYAHERRHRIPLPTYPFERQRYWIEPQFSADPAKADQKLLRKKQNIADWFYVPVWKQAILPQPVINAETLRGGDAENLSEIFPVSPCPQVPMSSWLVFVDAFGVGSQIAKRLEQMGQDVITVRVGEQFTKLNDFTYTIHPQRQDDYNALVQALRIRDLTPQKIIHVWSLTPNDTLPSNSAGERTRSLNQFFEDCQNLGFYSLLFLAQALGKQDFHEPVTLMVVTSNIHDVTGEERLYPEKATVLGPCKVIPQEYPNITCCSIDVMISSSKTSPSQKLIDQLIAEFTAQPTESVVAYRGHHRWVQTFEAVRLDSNIAGNARLRKGGVYLITGGLGGIGLVLAENLAKTLQAKLILTGRKGLPERSQWSQWLATHDRQDAVSRNIQSVLALEELGAEVQVISADVANTEQMQTAIAQALEQFGQIHGVIHAAGIAGGGIVQLKTLEIASSILAPKVKGTLVLEEVFKNINLDFLILCSSLSSILGGFGQVDYCAANAFLDAYAHYHASKGNQFTASINWDVWQEVGMTVETTVPDDLKQLREENLKKGILPQEGADALSRILQSEQPQIVVSTQEFQTRIEQYYSFNSLEENFAQVNLSKPSHSRPNLSDRYVVPRNEIEQTVVNIWQQLFGIEQVGIYDNFFELGGHSLLLTQLLNRLHATFKTDISMSNLFENPTIAGISKLIIDKSDRMSELKKETSTSKSFNGNIEIPWEQKVIKRMKYELPFEVKTPATSHLPLSISNLEREEKMIAEFAQLSAEERKSLLSNMLSAEEEE